MSSLRIGTAAAATALASILVAGCGSSASPDHPSAAGSSPASPSAGSNATAGPGTGDLFATGRLTRDGKPVEGAKVGLTAEPGDLESYGESPSADPQAPLTATTDRHGRWSLRVDPAKVDFSPGGHTLDVEITWRAGGTTASWEASIARVRKVWRTEGAGPADSVARFDVDLGTARVEATDSRGHTRRDQVPIG